MDKKDRKDEIILQQLEVIQTLTEHNLRRMGTDFWGTPKTPGPSEDPKTPDTPKAPGTEPAAKTESAGETEAPPPEKLEDLQAELESYVGDRKSVV